MRIRSALLALLVFFAVAACRAAPSGNGPAASARQD
jgi:hypothetical protein